MSLAPWAYQSAGKGRESFCKKSTSLGIILARIWKRIPCPLPLQPPLFWSANLPLSSTLRFCKDTNNQLISQRAFYIYQPGRLRLIQLQIKAKALAMPGEPYKCIFHNHFSALWGLAEAAHNFKTFGKLWGYFLITRHLSFSQRFPLPYFRLPKNGIKACHDSRPRPANPANDVQMTLPTAVQVKPL